MNWIKFFKTPEFSFLNSWLYQAPVIIFLRHLGVMLKAGLAISESLEIIREQSVGRIKNIVGGIESSMEAGNSFSDSLIQFPNVFSEHVVSACRAGEMSGRLEENLLEISRHLEKQRELRNKIKSAMAYPAVVFSLAIVLGLGISYYVLPKITPLFESIKTDLPAATKSLIWLSGIMTKHGAWVLFGLLGWGFLLLWILMSKWARPVIHYLALRLPYIEKIVKTSNLADFSGSLGSLFKSGLNIDEAMEISASSVKNYYFQKQILEIAVKIREGSSVAESLEGKQFFFPKVVSGMVRIGEKSGNLDESLFYLADFFEQETDRSIKFFATAVEPFLLVVVGIAVAWLALAIITPMYKITSVIM